MNGSSRISEAVSDWWTGSVELPCAAGAVLDPALHHDRRRTVVGRNSTSEPWDSEIPIPVYFRLKPPKPNLKSDDIQTSAHFNTSRPSHDTRSVGTKNHHHDSNAIVETFFSTRTMFLKRTETHYER